VAQPGSQTVRELNRTNSHRARAATPRLTASKYRSRLPPSQRNQHRYSGPLNGASPPKNGRYGAKRAVVRDHR
jgi:hypothetical protein